MLVPHAFVVTVHPAFADVAKEPIRVAIVKLDIINFFILLFPKIVKRYCYNKKTHELLFYSQKK